ncbi:hypothetical protein Cgig2_027533 [Carnegiea gigantea]|uniref:Uncharacterized protein n=1 Tax=Carnegiea gigantea TaxID=171969 RepID=A0A9Q1GQ61_9CARY|nr:hypothetical protein Cgig2_027533 [Carnegiea gigantea]
MDIMFSNTFAIGEHSWDLYAPEVNENRGREGQREDEAVEEQENVEVIRNVRTEESGYDDCGVPNISLENIEVDNVDSVEQDGKKKKKACSSKEGKENPTKKIKSKVGTAAGIQSQLDRIVEAAESFVPHFTATSMSNDIPGCTIAECMSLLKTLPSVELGSELYMLGARLFIKRQYREMFITLEDDGDDGIDITKIKKSTTEEDKMNFDDSEDENEEIEMSDDDDDYEQIFFQHELIKRRMLLFITLGAALLEHGGALDDSDMFSLRTKIARSLMSR